MPDVMVGLVELCRLLVEPGAAVAFASPAYPPFFVELRRRSGAGSPSAPTRPGGSTSTRSTGASTGRPRARARKPAQPDRPRARRATELRGDRGALRRGAARGCSPTRSTRRSCCRARRTLPGSRCLTPRARAGSRSPRRRRRSTSPRSRPPFAVTAGGRPRVTRSGASAQHDRAELLGAIASEAAFARATNGSTRSSGSSTANRALLGRATRRASAGGRWTPPRGDATWPGSTAARSARRRPGGGLPRARPRRAQPRPGLRPEGAGYVRLNFATSPAHLSDATGRMVTAISRSS